MHVGWIVAMLGQGAFAGGARAPAMDVGVGATVRAASPAATLGLGLDAIHQGRFALRVGVSLGSPRMLPEVEEDGQRWPITRSVWRIAADLEPRFRVAAPLSVFGSVGVARLSFHQQGRPVSGSRLTPTIGAGVELGWWRVGVRPMIALDLARFDLEQPDGRRTAWTPLAGGATLFVRFGRNPAKSPVATDDSQGRAAGDRTGSRKSVDFDDPILPLPTSEG